MSMHIPDPNASNDAAAPESADAAATGANEQGQAQDPVQHSADAAPASAGANKEPTPGGDASAVDPQAAAMAAFERGVAETPKDEMAAIPAVPDKDGAAGEGGDPAKPKKDDQAKTPDADAIAAAADAGGADGKAKLDAAVEKEIKDLGITSDRATKRFRELSQKAAQVEPLQTKAAQLEDWNETIQSTGADPEQLGRSLGYLAAINSRDPTQMNQAYDALSQELAWLGERLGRDAPGFDPLSKHPDLLALVEAGELPRATAKELVAARQSGALVQEQRTTQDQATQIKRQQDDALVEVAKLGDTLRAAEPEHFQQKFATLLPTIKIIQRTLPPAQWSKEIEAAYRELPAMAAPAPSPNPRASQATTPQPLRPTGTSPAQMRAPTNDVDAFALGVAEAKAAGL